MKYTSKKERESHRTEPLVVLVLPPTPHSSAELIVPEVMMTSSLLVALGLLPAKAPVEAGVDINVPGERFLATPLGGAADRDIEVGLLRSELLGEETAVSTETLAGLLEVSSLELLTNSFVHPEHAQDLADDAELLVDLVLLLCVGGAEGRIEGTRERFLAHAVRLLVVKLLAAVLGLAAAGRRRRSVGLLVVSLSTNSVTISCTIRILGCTYVRANDDYLESGLVLSLVRGRLVLDVLSPDAALELGDGRSLAGALIRVELGIPLNEDVEASAGLSRVTVGGARSRVVASQDLVCEISRALNRSVKVRESLLVSRGCLSRFSKILVDSVALESVDGIRRRWWTVGIRLSCTWVERVDEAAVRSNLNSSRASCVGRESPRVGPIDRSTRGGCDVGGRRVGGGR